MNRALVDELRRQLERRNLIVLVGPGVAMATTTAAPSWRDLLHLGVERCEEVATGLPPGWGVRVRQQILTGGASELLRAAESITESLGGHEDERYSGWLREVFEPLTPEWSEIVRVLPDLQDLGGLIATTNYDGLIEAVTGWSAVTLRHPGQMDRMIYEARPCVLHLHGYWNEPSSVVLGIRSYEQAIRDQYTQALLHRLAQTKTMLLLGFDAGLDDPNFDALRDWLRAIRGSKYRHVRLCRQAEWAQLQPDPSEPIDLLPYGRDYADLVPFLRRLTAPISAATGPAATSAPTRGRPVASATTVTVAPRLPWLMRLRDREGGLTGTAFLIEGGYVLTCAHLVRDALGLVGRAPGPDDLVELVLPLPGQLRVLNAHVIPGGWFPSGPQRDVAVLELSEELPTDTLSTILHEPSDVLDHRYRVHGFARGADHELNATGTITDPGLPRLEWVQLDLDAVSHGHEDTWLGFEGSPVWDETAGGVVGLVVAEDHYSGSSVAWMVPIRVIQEIWPPLPVRRQATVVQRADVVPSAPTDPSVAKKVAPSQFPRPISEFVGREDELAQIFELLTADRRAREPLAWTILIYGKPGVGKSTLAIKVAERLSPTLPDGQLYADLLPLRGQPRVNVADVLAEFLLALGVDGVAIPQTLDERAALYQARLRRRRLLIVLDNAADVRQVQVLRPYSPGCIVLVTSRAPLTELEGSHFELELFDSEESITLLAALAGQERVEREREAAEDIVELCAYLPLAVSVAGARLAASKERSLTEYAERLRRSRNRLNELTVGPAEVRSSLMMSYEDRDKDEQQAFKLLSLLKVRSFPAWVAAALLDADTSSAVGLMDKLLKGQLLENDGHDAAGQQRYRFHGLLRDLAGELVEDEPATTQKAARARVLTTYVALAKAASTLREPHERRQITRQDVSIWSDMRDPSVIRSISREPLRWLAAERSSLVAMAESANEAELWPLSWQLAEAMVDFFELRAHWDDWRQLNTLALDAARHARDRRAEVRALRQIGDLHRDQRHWQDAIDRYEECLDILNEQDNPYERAATLHCRGLAQRDEGRWDAAIDSIEACLPVFAAADRRAWAIATYDLGVAQRNRGDWNLAIKYITESLAVFEEIDDRRGQAHALRGIGVAHRNHGQWQQAINCFERAAALFRDLDERRGLARTLANRGDVYQEQGHFEAATRDLGECLMIHHERGDRRFVADTERRFSVLLRKQGHFAQALACLHACLPVLQVPGEERWEHYALHNLAEVYIDLREYDKAYHYLERCLRVFQRIDDRLWEAKTLSRLGVVLSQRKPSQRQQAESRWDVALTIFEDLGSPDAGEVRTLLRRS